MFYLSIAGVLPQDPAAALKLDALLGRLRALLEEKPRLLVTPGYTDPSWLDWARRSGCPLDLLDGGEDSPWTELCSRRLSLDMPLRYQLGEELCDRADLLLLIWDGAPGSHGGLPWELLRLVQARNMPCVWLCDQTGELYWPDGSCFEPFSTERLEELCHAYQQEDLSPSPEPEHSLPFLPLGARLRAHFLRRFKAAYTLRYEDEDLMLRQDYKLPEHARQAEGVRRELLRAYQALDASAVRFNERYQAVLYWRAILPFVSTMLIALGFYATSLLAALPLPVPMRFWQYLSALGFLLYGTVNLYVFSLSRNDTVKLWHRGFLRDRYLAELLRVALHFLPFGIRLDLRRLCDGRTVAAGAVRHLAEDALDERRVFTLNDTSEAMEQLRRLLSDQLAYHEAAGKRYKRLVAHLERWAGRLIWTGFILVLLRTALQMMLPFLRFPEVSFGAGVRLGSLVGTVGNALAMLVPAFGSYFSTKLTLCNFRFDCGYHERMREQLRVEQQRLERLCTFSGPIPAEAVHELGEDLARIMLLQDTSQWLQQYETATVTRL